MPPDVHPGIHNDLSRWRCHSKLLKRLLNGFEVKPLEERPGDVPAFNLLPLALLLPGSH